MQSKQFPFWILTIAVFCGLLLPLMVQEGMFTDGLLYSSVAHNLANGIGTFWFPKFDELGFAGLKTFHEQPPLYFGIQALFFKLFGDGYFVEKLHSLLAALITAWLIFLVWKKININRHKFSNMTWLPLLFWIIIPIVFYSYQNNLIEGTMSIFTLATLIFCLKAFEIDSKKYLYLGLAGIFIFLASLTKGVPGFFPLVIPGLWWLIKRGINFGQTVIYTFILILVPAVIYMVILFFSSDAGESLSIYVNSRLLGRIGSAHTVTNRFHIMNQLFLKLIPVLSLSFIILVIDRLRSFKQPADKEYFRDIIFFMALGLSGTVPLMMTLVQKSFYFVHALPFFAIGFALLVVPVISGWIGRINNRRLPIILNSIFITGLIAVLIYTGIHIGKRGRDRDLLHDVHLLAETIPEKSIISIDRSMHNNWASHCYFSRYYYISLDPFGNGNQYLLLDKTLSPDEYEFYKQIDAPLKFFNLFQINEP